MNEIKQLNRAYTKRFKHLNKNILVAENSGLLVFVEHLKYIRDAYILTSQSIEVIATLNTAIAEFEAYRDTKKDFHWNNYCEFLKQNMKEWLAVNDPV